MKLLCSWMMVLIFRQADAGIVRKPPAFSTPVYSNSYLPAAMQVIFHVVEQLKSLQLEEMSQEQSTTRSSPSTIQSVQHPRPQSATPGVLSATIPTTATTVACNGEVEIPKLSSASPAVMEDPSTHGSIEADDGLTEEAAQRVETWTASDREEFAEVNEETVETNYATPETNHESPEPVQEIQESNQEMPEESEEESSLTGGNQYSATPRVETSQRDNATRERSARPSAAGTSDDQRKKKPTIDSVVDEIYEILKPTPSLLEESGATDESKDGTSLEKMESVEDEEEETRFTLLGEKVTQVPRPSLNSYLRRAKVPPNRALQQLANLYDALSKDARKQGFARFAGYSDEVLGALQSSAEGGAGPQLKRLLRKVVERNELTRDDAKLKASEALQELDNPASALSKDLRRLLPLRYMI